MSFLVTMKVKSKQMYISFLKVRISYASKYNAYRFESYCKASLIDFPVINICSIYAQDLKLMQFEFTFPNPNNIAFSYAAISFIYAAKPKRQ